MFWGKVWSAVLMMQVVRSYSPERIITVDALPLRCELSVRLGADVSINAEEEDPIQRCVVSPMAKVQIWL